MLPNRHISQRKVRVSELAPATDPRQPRVTAQLVAKWRYTFFTTSAPTRKYELGPGLHGTPLYVYEMKEVFIVPVYIQTASITEYEEL